MQHGHLLLLLIIVFVSSSKGESPIERNTASLQHQHPGSQRLLTSDDTAIKVTTIYEAADEGDEERVLTMPSMSKIGKLFGKRTDLSKKLINLRKDTDVVTTIEKDPVMKNVATALDKNPSSLKKLVKDPDVLKVAASMDGKIGRFTKADISTLRRVFAKNPVKANKFDAGIKVIEAAMTGVIAVGVVSLLILALLVVVTATK